jgi:hypothetical protein
LLKVAEDLSVNVAVRMQRCPAYMPLAAVSVLRSTAAPVVFSVPSVTPSPQPLIKNRPHNRMEMIIRDVLVFIVLSSF